MTRQDFVLILRKLLLRMEREEWEFDEYFGSTSYNDDKGYLTYAATGIDTFRLRFLGPKQKTAIPNVLVVWPDSTTEHRPYTNLVGLLKQGERPILLYCPVSLKEISPERHRRRVSRILQSANVQFIKDSQ